MRVVPGSVPWLRPFGPRRFLRNGHAQTIAGNFLKRSVPQPPAPELFTVAVEAAHTLRAPDGRAIAVGETQVLCLGNWQALAVRAQRLTVVLLHGLEGSAGSGYMLGLASLLWTGGCNVVRMNMRSCGGAEALAPTIYHSGRSEDVGCVVDVVRERGCGAVALVGYSMGGNLVLRYAGEASRMARERGEPLSICAVAGVSPLLDLSASSTALHHWSNWIYEQRFLRAMKRRLRAKAALFPELYGSLEAEGVLGRIRSMRAFDGEIVARYGGFRDAEDYYERVRASAFAAELAVPTLILHAADDPFLRTLPDTREALLTNPHVQYVETTHGGHCAFLAEQEPSANGDGRWAEETVARWLLGEVCADR